MSKHCSFCGRPSPTPTQQITGNEGVRICFDCVFEAQRALDSAGELPPQELNASLSKPREIKAFLDEHIIGQDQAKKALAVAVYNHYKRLEDSARAPELIDLKEEPNSPTSETRELSKEGLRQEAMESPVKLSKGNILMVGPTGVGKTALAERIAELLDVPFVVKDATTLTAAGYVGEDVETIIKSLWEAAGRDTERAARGIVVIDEVDKIARRGASSQSGRDVGGESVQQALLKLIEGSHVNIQPDAGRMARSAPIQIDTTNILFILCGAFVGLDKLIERRMSPGSIGFGKQSAADAPLNKRSKKDLSYNELIPDLQVTDLLKFGMIPEFMGRLPVLVYLEDLDESALREILWKPKDSLVKQYQQLFALNEVTLTFTDEALTELVRKAMTRKSGARALRSVLEHLMLNIMYELPDRAELAEVIIDAPFVRGEAEQPTYVNLGESA